MHTDNNSDCPFLLVERDGLRQSKNLAMKNPRVHQTLWARPGGCQAVYKDIGVDHFCPRRLNVKCITSFWLAAIGDGLLFWPEKVWKILSCCVFYLLLQKTETASANKPCTNSIWKSQVQQKWRDTTNYWRYQVWKDLYRETRWTRGVNKFLKLHEFSKKALKQTTYKVSINQRFRVSCNHEAAHLWDKSSSSLGKMLESKKLRTVPAVSGAWPHRNCSSSHAREDTRRHWKPPPLDQQGRKFTWGPEHTYKLPKTCQAPQVGRRNA